MSEDQEKYGKDAPERFADSREEDAWVGFAAAALAGWASGRNNGGDFYNSGANIVSDACSKYADSMMVEWRRRARGR